MLDPNELAAKGATLLHHLAVWMMEEQRGRSESTSQLNGKKHSLKSDPRLSASFAVTSSTSTSCQERVFRNRPRSATELQQVSAQTSSFVRGQQHHHRGSECDRPDSGFDSKDEDEVRGGLLGSSTSGPPTLLQQLHQRQVSEAISEEVSAGARVASSGDTSPELTTEISRQALIRQPIFRKRRLHHMD